MQLKNSLQMFGYVLHSQILFHSVIKPVFPALCWFTVQYLHALDKNTSYKTDTKIENKYAHF